MAKFTRLLLLGFLFGLCVPGWGQAVMTATIVDSDSVSWISGSYTVQLVNLSTGAVIPQGQAFVTSSGATVTTSFGPTTLDGSGALSVTLTPSASITPAGTGWKFRICPNTIPQSCGGTTLTITSSGSISSQLSASITAPRIGGGIGTQGYADVEANAVAGNTYYNILTPVQRCYAAAWANCGGGGGAVSSVFTRTGAVVATSGDYTVSQVTGAAPLASPALTGTPTVPTVTVGTNTTQAASTAFVQANAVGVLIPPSGDTTGATDGAAIQTACGSNNSVRLTAGNYYVGASNAVITLSAPCKIQGAGFPTVVTNEGTTNDIFRISYFTTWSEGPWVYPASTNQTEISDMQFAQAGTPTAGFIFDVGSGIPSSGGIFSYTMNVHIHDTVANGLWGGLKLVPDELYAFVNHNMWRQFVGGGAVLYSACLGSGDNHISDNEFSGLTNSGIIITCSDTTMFAHDKLNGSGITFTGAAAAKTVQFTDMSVETGISQPCAWDFGTGTAPTNIQIDGGEQLGFNQLFCHPSNITHLAFHLANSVSTADYPAGLISNAGYTTVLFPNFQDFATFAGTTGTLLSAYTTQAGKTFSLYSSSAGTVIPQLNGSSAMVLPSGTDSTFGDSLDTLTPASANYTTSVTCTRGASGSPTYGVYVRALSGANTNYIAQFAPGSGGQLQLYADVAGTPTELAHTNFTWAAGTTHTIALTATGTAIAANIDGTTTATATDATVAAAGQAGFRITGGSNVTCTNFYVQ